MEMQSEVMIQLHKPVTAPGGEVIKQITLRSPTLRDVEDLGAPAVERGEGAARQLFLNYPVMGAYIRRCVVAPAGAESWLNDVGLADSFRLINEMLRMAKAVHAAALAMPGLPY